MAPAFRGWDQSPDARPVADPQRAGDRSGPRGPGQRPLSLHVELLQLAASHPGEAVNPFTVAETFRHYILDRNIIGSVRKSSEYKEYIHKYKAYYVHAMRDPIKAAATRFNLPAVLVAGTIYNEVGGADMIKPYVELLRRVISGPEAADRTSIGPTSLQPRRALAALGYDPAKVDQTLRIDVVAVPDSQSPVCDLRVRQAPERSPRSVLPRPRR